MKDQDPKTYTRNMLPLANLLKACAIIVTLTRNLQAQITKLSAKVNINSMQLPP